MIAAREFAKWKAFAVSIWLFACFAREHAHATPVHSVGLGNYQSSTQAAAAREQLQELKPVTTIVTDSTVTTAPYALAAGEFPMKAQAWVYKQALARQQPAEIDTSHTRVVEWEKQGQTTGPIELPIAKPFVIDDITTALAATHATSRDSLVSLGLWTQGTSISAGLSAKTINQMSRDELKEFGYKIDRNTSGVDALERLITQYPQDSEINRHQLRLSRRLMKKDPVRSEQLLSSVLTSGTTEEQSVAKLYRAYWHSQNSSDSLALAAFQSLGSDSSVPIAYRREAIRAAGSIAHRIKDYPTAWLTFEQLVDVDTDTSSVANARVELAGLALELAGAAKANYGDCRQLCEQVLNMAAAPRQSKATSALMHLEAWYWDNDSTQALTECDQFLTEFTDQRREYSLALLWKGILLQQVGRNSESIPILKEVTDLQLSAEDKFADLEPAAHAAAWLVRLASERGDSAEKQQYLELLRQRYPQSRQYREALTVR